MASVYERALNQQKSEFVGKATRDEVGFVRVPYITSIMRNAETIWACHLAVISGTIILVSPPSCQVSAIHFKIGYQQISSLNEFIDLSSE